MKFILKYSPAFLKRFDQHLRVRHAWIWATQIHLNLYVGIILTAIFSLIGWVGSVQEENVMSSNELEVFFGTLFFPAGIYLIFFLIQMSLFNPDKIYGKRSHKRTWGEFLIYFVSFALPLLIPYSTVTILNWRTASLVEDEQLVRDRSAWLYAQVYLDRNDYDLNYYPDDQTYMMFESRYCNSVDKGFGKVNEIPTYLIDVYEDMRDSIANHRGVFASSRPRLYYGDLSYYDRVVDPFLGTSYASIYDNFDRGWMVNSDSVLSMYVCWVNITRDDKFAMKKIDDYCQVAEKYSYRKADTYKDLIVKAYKENIYAYSELGRLPYYNDVVDDNLRYIQRAKDWRADCFDDDLLPVIPSVCFFLALLFFLFKNVNWPEFLLSAATIVVLLIVLGVVAALSRSGDAFLTMSLMLVWFAVIRSFFLGRSEYFTRARVIMAVLGCLALPVMWVFTLGWMAEVLDFFQWSLFDSYYVTGYDQYGSWYKSRTSAYYDMKQACFLYAYWGGIVLWLTLGLYHFKKVFLKLWAVPKRT